MYNTEIPFIFGCFLIVIDIDVYILQREKRMYDNISVIMDNLEFRLEFKKLLFNNLPV